MSNPKKEISAFNERFPYPPPKRPLERIYNVMGFLALIGSILFAVLAALL